MPTQPSVYSAQQIWGTLAVTADRNAFLTPQAGRRLTGFSVNLPTSSGNVSGRIMKGATVSAGEQIYRFELITNVKPEVIVTLPEGGLDVASGVSLDFIAGPAGFDCTLFYIDVT